MAEIEVLTQVALTVPDGVAVVSVGLLNEVEVPVATVPVGPVGVGVGVGVGIFSGQSAMISSQIPSWGSEPKEISSKRTASKAELQAFKPF